MSVSSQGSFSRKQSLSPTSPTVKLNQTTAAATTTLISTSNIAATTTLSSSSSAAATTAAAIIESGITRTNLKVSFKDRFKSLHKELVKEEKTTSSNESSFDAKQHLIPSTSTAKPKKPSTTQQLKDKIKSFGHHNTPKDELTPWSKLKLATVVSLGGSYTSLNNNLAEDSPKLSKTSIKSSMPVDLNTVAHKLDDPSSTPTNSPVANEIPKYKYDSKQKKHHHHYHHQNQQHHQHQKIGDSDLKSDMNFTALQPVASSKVKRKPKSFQLSKPKSYRSVDDLSPEYSGLPFVKKLKILNERIKLAELESVMQTRSLSLDCTDSNNSTDMVEVLTRSHSEASCMIRPNMDTLASPSPVILNAPLKSPLSPESNETLERKKLKSILKKLSEDRLSQQSVASEAKSGGGDRQDMKRLMRAQTLEGYVARRTKFTKSVTFNHTLSSPPSATLPEEPEESQKHSPPSSSFPTAFTSASIQTSPLPVYSISNAQTLDNSQNLLIHHQNINININSDTISTNRFNYSDDDAPTTNAFAQQLPSDILTTTTTTTTSATTERIDENIKIQPPSPETQPSNQPQHQPSTQFKNSINKSNNNNNTYSDSSTGTLAFLSDSYGERKLIKGTFLNFERNLFRLERLF